MMHELRGPISKAILEEEGSPEKLAKKYNLDINELIINDKVSYNLNYIKIIEIDTILITTRHLFRAPYSFNEKSELISIPIENSRISLFQKDEAKPQNVDPKKYVKYEFLNYNSNYGKDGNVLLLNADEMGSDLEDMENLFLENIIDNANKSHRDTMRSNLGKITTEGDFGDIFVIEEEVDIKDFPKTIDFVLTNNFVDGIKRAIFLLLTFLHSIKDMIYEWNDKQDDPLKKNYILPQILWFNSLEKKISPPNFNNANYYSSIGIPKEIIVKDKTHFKNKTMKNPLHYIYTLQKIKPKGKKKKQKNSGAAIKKKQVPNDKKKVDIIK